MFNYLLIGGDSNMEGLGERLNRLRNKQGISLNELAQKIETSNQEIKAWENGEDRPSVNKLREISQLYEVDLEKILPNRKLRTKKEDKILMDAEGGRGVLYLKNVKSQPFFPRAIIKNVGILEIKAGIMKVQVNDEKLTHHMILVSDVLGFLEEMN